jgi:hypothetical protein
MHHPFETHYDLIVDEPQLDYQGSTYVKYGNPYLVPIYIISYLNNISFSNYSGKCK